MSALFNAVGRMAAHLSEKIWLSPEVTSAKKIPKNHMRNVFTGIKGSSTLETAARTSGYGDSLEVNH